MPGFGCDESAPDQVAMEKQQNCLNMASFARSWRKKNNKNIGKKQDADNLIHVVYMIPIRFAKPGQDESSLDRSARVDS